MVCLPSELLLATNVSCLTSLKITRAILDGKSLIEVFRRCQNTLKHVVLHYVAYTTDDDLMPVYQAMLALPKLDFLELELFGAGVEPYWTIDTPHGGVCSESHRREGIGPIKDWLRGLLNRRLYLYQTESDSEA